MIKNEIIAAMQVTQLPTVTVFTFRKYGVEKFPQELEKLLQHLSVLTNDLQWAQIPTYVSLLEIILKDFPNANQWFQDEEIGTAILDHFLLVADVKEELDAMFRPQPLVNIDLGGNP